MSKLIDEIQNRALAAVQLAKDAGAQDSWATASQSRDVEYEWRDGRLERVTDSTSRSLALQIYVDGKYSSHNTTDLRPDQLPNFVADAVALTRALEPDEFRKIPDPKLFENRPVVDLQLFDPTVQTLTLEQRDAWCKEMDALIRDNPKVISGNSGVSDSCYLGAAASSNGFVGAWERSEIWLGGSVTVQDEGDKRPEGWYYTGGRHLSELEKPADIAKKALQRALERLGTSKGPTGKFKVVVQNEAGPRLISAILDPASAAAVQQKRSFWANTVGKQIFGQMLSMVDNPLIPKGLASRHFDGEGISARSIPLVDAGTVRNLYVDTYYGRKLQIAPTTGGRSNVVVVPGTKTPEQLLQEVGNGIYVTSWLGGNSDSTTGDFSFGIRGHLIENGVIGKPVGEANITGNLMVLFQRLVALGNDPYLYSSLRVPTMVFDGLEVSGS